jgi:hypothetical protein
MNIFQKVKKYLHSNSDDELGKWESVSTGENMDFFTKVNFDH